MRFGELPVHLTLDRCLLTYPGDVPETAGKVGEGYFFAAPQDTFAGDLRTPQFRRKAAEIQETCQDRLGSRVSYHRRSLWLWTIKASCGPCWRCGLGFLRPCG
jgi:hypothetical protein